MTPLKLFIIFLAIFSIVKVIFLVITIKKIKPVEMTEEEKVAYDKEADAKFFGDD